MNHRGTWLAPEENAYPHGGQTRKGQAIFKDGKLRVVWGGIPDTFFTIPAHCTIRGKRVRGYLTCEDGVWIFNTYKDDRIWDQMQEAAFG